MEWLRQTLVFSDLLITDEERSLLLSRHLNMKVSKGTSEESLHEVSEDCLTARNPLQNSRIAWQYRTEIKSLGAGAKHT